MLDFLSTTPAQVVIAVTALAMLTVVGWYVVSKFRESAEESGPTASQLLANFREMRQQGDIDETEYRTIKTALSAKLQHEVTERNQAG